MEGAVSSSQGQGLPGAGLGVVEVYAIEKEKFLQMQQV